MRSRLFYVIGPSGAGKDSLIEYVRRELDDAPVRFACRYITRSADAGGESHQTVSVEAFEALRNRGDFAMYWSGNGLQYGVGVEIDDWLDAGIIVVVNGSRDYLPTAAQRYPSLIPVLITVSDAVLSKRLMARGRETLPEIEDRMARSQMIVRPAHKALVVINNDGDLAVAGQALLSVITQGQSDTMNTRI
jgi:ribose 1,5-bisphosphokinase